MTTLKNAIKTIVKGSVLDSLKDIRDRFYYKESEIAGFYTAPLSGKSGIEIGGPSKLFKYNIPIYKDARELDGVNFASYTEWEGAINTNKYKYYGEKPGTQYISEASELASIKDEAYDFLISSNCLEHVANPLKALKEWTRVVKKNGYLMLVLPKKEDTFDHRRPITTFEHLKDDFDSNIDEHDLTHLDEIVRLHDLSMDPPAGTLEQFVERSKNNFENRCLHHHIFDAELMRKMFDFASLSLVREDSALGNYIALGRKL